MQRQGFLWEFILYISALLKWLQQSSHATFMGGELKAFCASSKWQKICPSATVLFVAHDDGRANDISGMQADNSWEWMCPLVHLDYVKWDKHPSFCVSYFIDTRMGTWDYFSLTLSTPCHSQVNMNSERLSSL